MDVKVALLPDKNPDPLSEDGNIINFTTAGNWVKYNSGSFIQKGAPMLIKPSKAPQYVDLVTRNGIHVKGLVYFGEGMDLNWQNPANWDKRCGKKDTKRLLNFQASYFRMTSPIMAVKDTQKSGNHCFYYFKPNEERTKVIMHVNNYGIQLKQGLNAYLVDYGQYPNSKSKRTGMFGVDEPEDTEGDISGFDLPVKAIEITGKYYNLNGQLAGDNIYSLPKGIYIKDGKKVVVK